MYQDFPDRLAVSELIEASSGGFEGVDGVDDRFELAILQPLESVDEIRMGAAVTSNDFLLFDKKGP